MLNSDSRPAKPAAIPAMIVFWSAESWLKDRLGRPISLPAKISCNIGEAIPITPIPADTFRHSTHQISQNCGVLCASLRWTLFVEIIALTLVGAVQPSGRQPAGDTRYAK